VGTGLPYGLYALCQLRASAVVVCGLRRYTSGIYLRLCLCLHFCLVITLLHCVCISKGVMYLCAVSSLCPVYLSSLAMLRLDPATILAIRVHRLIEVVRVSRTARSLFCRHIGWTDSIQHCCYDRHSEFEPSFQFGIKSLPTVSLPATASHHLSITVSKQKMLTWLWALHACYFSLVVLCTELDEKSEKWNDSCQQHIVSLLILNFVFVCVCVCFLKLCAILLSILSLLLWTG